MIVEIASTLTPNPIVVDTDSKSEGGGALAILKLSVRVRSGPGGAVLASYTPHGSPEGSPIPFVLLGVGVLVVTFALIGVAKSL